MMKFLGVLMTLLCLLMVGCDRTDKSLQAEDESNPNIREALAAQRDFNFADAAKAYEAALVACPDVAIAHFDLGLLYADRLNDPIRAMYHFQCYIDQRPQADNREGAEKRLDSIKIQFAATVPNSPIQNAEAFAKLQADNQNLLKELDDARGRITVLEAKVKPDGAEPTAPPVVAVNPVRDTPDVKPDGTSAPAAAPSVDTATPDSASAAAVTPAPIATQATTASAAAPPAPVASTTAPTAPPTPTESAEPAPTTPAVATPSVPIASTPPVAAIPAVAAPAPDAAPKRTYTVTKGDTLWSISKHYYPGQINSGIEKIKAANTDKLAEGKPLRIGLVLVIP